MNLPFYWSELTESERIQYAHDLGDRLLEHRYRYYILAEPVVEDSMYDYLERYYEFICNTLQIDIVASEMVDFDLKRQDAQSAKERVDSNTDYYSIWINRMQPIWDSIGYPKYNRPK